MKITALPLAQQIQLAGLPMPQAEYPFAKPRRWRADWAWPDRMLLAEREGATWTRGRHSRGAGYRKDCEKYNAAQMLGYTVLRFTVDMERDGSALRCLTEALS